MKKIICSLAVTVQFVFLLGCIGAYDNSALTFGRLIVCAAIAVTGICLCFRHMEQNN